MISRSKQWGADLIVGLRQAGVATTALLDRILIKNWTTAGNKIENIAFSDGTQYALTDWKPGTTVNNSLAGDALANRLYGGEGADTINGAAGADWMSGGTGNDTYVVDDTGDVILEASSLLLKSMLFNPASATPWAPTLRTSRSLARPPSTAPATPRTTC
jgi:Ca2+-binding RTX toxin-like protein